MEHRIELDHARNVSERHPEMSPDFPGGIFGDVPETRLRLEERRQKHRAAMWTYLFKIFRVRFFPEIHDVYPTSPINEGRVCDYIICDKAYLELVLMVYQRWDHDP